MRRASVLAVTLPLAVAGSLTAHALAYRLAYGSSSARALEVTGHGYLAHAPMVLGLLGSLGVVSLVVLAASGEAAVARVSTWPFALLAPLAFLAQEHGERWLETGSPPWGTIADPAVRWGLALQAPFAIAAWLIARFALRGAALVSRRVAAKTARPRLQMAARLTPPATAPTRRRGLLASNRGGRAPPVVVGS